ncbi:M24 family metallopeptidase [Parvularcula dongshanensis]|uniref:Xaa-Pro dipeptidase n=1 Tax=Parvularcula dongshanensis TaxID=1173995 RepID=A0A840I4T6_9PROT|nr:Xaa-Pro peptidase family protein [Parvularcula dongshanensis]MBB4659040.1 Xaa-Pro dipeptidase [Parvularcula dongshanensis]
MIDKRSLLKGAAALAAAPLANASATAGPAVRASRPVPPAITPEEHRARLSKLQRLMGEAGTDLVVLEPGAPMTYFTGLRWWRSERPTLALVPQEGDVQVVTPGFEAPSVRESLLVPAEVSVWQEDEDPFALAARLVGEPKRIGIEETVRFFIADGMRGALPEVKVVPAAPMTRACRMIKSPAELALMQAATDATMRAYGATFEQIRVGMAARAVSGIMREAMQAEGLEPEFALVLLNEASAYPHGTEAPQTVREGGIVLMDCGGTLRGYQSDVSRTFVLGEPTKRQQEVWDTVRRGQQIAMETAQVGVPAGAVDKAVRDYYEAEGWGPGYKTPGLSHRLGHGIGMEGHEPINLVGNETTELAPGMCFSNEPGLYDFESFGVRLEDCFVVTEDGPRAFSPFQPEIGRPV